MGIDHDRLRIDAVFAQRPGDRVAARDGELLVHGLIAAWVGKPLDADLLYLMAARQPGELGDLLLVVGPQRRLREVEMQNDGTRRLCRHLVAAGAGRLGRCRPGRGGYRKHGNDGENSPIHHRG